ncbi:MAG: hypothetical protein EXR55_06505 [Dehalococcoidia bacterium]|nr:hypothetical protein [Dehalococcoidia bacterium]
MTRVPFISWVLVLTSLAVLGSPAVIHAAGPEEIFRGGNSIVVGGSIAALAITLVVLILLAIVLGVLGLGGLTVVAVSLWLLGGSALILGLGVGETFLAGAMAGLVLGRWGLEGRWPTGRLAFWGWLATGTLVYVLIAGAPWIGGRVELLVALLSLGAVGLALWARRRGLGVSQGA